MLTSRVKIEDESPNRTPFATRIASSSRATGISAVVGPKISSCAIAHPRLDVAEDRRAVEEALVEPVAGRDLAAGQQRRALVPADLRVRVDLLERGAG